ncbi:unnamed protein product [Rhodiola kirilowii]
METRVSHGSVSLLGRRRVMEDAITVAPPNLPCTHEFFAVYDGRGGPRVSTACHERLHLILADEIARHGADWRSVMKASFNKMDDLVKGTVGALVEDGFHVVPAETIGSTATVVMVGEEEIVVANCGDSRVVLFSGGAALPLSHDHKSDDPKERARLESEQRDIKLDLPVTRTIGHHGHVMKHCLIPDPQVEVRHRTQWDKFLIIASHGLWDVVSNEGACAVVKNCLDGHIRRSLENDSVTSSAVAVAATTLAEFAMARGSKDNISLVVVEL